MPTWTPKVCKITAFMAITMGLGLFFAYFGGLGIPQLPTELKIAGVAGAVELQTPGSYVTSI